MSDASHIARPYARAVFEFVQAAQEDLAEWQRALDLLAAVAGDAAFARCTIDPRITTAQILAAVCDTLATANKVSVAKLHPPLVNLVKLLVEYRRLSAAPEIARRYGELCAEQTRTVAATMTTAAPVDDQQRKQFAAALQTKLDRKVQLEFAVDESLIGGAVVRAGDRVIDGSVRAQLEQLAGALRA